MRFNLQTRLKSLSSIELLASEGLDWAAVTYCSSQCNRQILLFWKRGRKSKQKQLINMCIFICFGKEKLSRYKEYNTCTNDTPALDYCFGLFWVRSCHDEKCFCPFCQIINQQKRSKKTDKTVPESPLNALSGHNITTASTPTQRWRASQTPRGFIVKSFTSGNESCAAQETSEASAADGFQS